MRTTNQTWQLVLNNYFIGYLRYKDGWTFNGNSLEELTSYLGDYIITWYQ
jgi:hypothetical protein